jgi:hypothetical protein
MTSVRAMGRLLWRPASVFGAFPILLAAAWPIILLGDRLDSGLRLSSPEGLSEVLWGESIALISVLGMILTWVAREAHQSVFAFNVPGLRRKILEGKGAFGVALSMAVAGIMLTTGDVRAAVEIFACALFFFALGGALADPITPTWLSAVTGLALVASALQPTRVRFLFETAPTVSVIVALLAFGVITYRETSTAIARMRVLLPKLPEGYAIGPRLWRAYLNGTTTTMRNRHHSPATGRLRDWVLAVDYENFGMRHFGWLGLLLFIVALNAGMAYGLNNPGFVAILGAMHVAYRGHRLKGQWAYPLSRVNRARLHFVLNLIDGTSYAALATLAFWLLQKTNLPAFPVIDVPDRRESPGLAVVAVAAIWYPLVQWPSISAGWHFEKLIKGPVWAAKFMGLVLASVSLTFGTYALLHGVAQSVSIGAAVVAGLALAMAVQLGYWLLVKRHFERKDLI